MNEKTEAENEAFPDRLSVDPRSPYYNAEILARVSRGLGDAMSGLSAATLAPAELLETRGW